MATVDVAIVGGGIAGLAAAYELRQRGVVGAGPRSRHRAPAASSRPSASTAGSIDGGPDSMLVQKPAAVALCRELGLGRSADLDADAAHGLRAARRPAASTRRRIVPRLSARDSARWRAPRSSPSAGKLRLAGELFIPRRARRRGRIDRRVRATSIRRGGGRLSGRAAAGRHPRRRRRTPVDARALPAPARGRASVGQRAARVSRAARDAVAAGRVRLAARRHRRARRRAARHAAGHRAARTRA